MPYFVLMVLAILVPLVGILAAIAGSSFLGEWLRYARRVCERPVPEHTVPGLHGLQSGTRDDLQALLEPLRRNGFRVALVAFREGTGVGEGARRRWMFVHAAVYLVNEETGEVACLQNLTNFTAPHRMALELSFVTALEGRGAVETRDGAGGYPYDPPAGHALLVVRRAGSLDDLYRRHRRGAELFAGGRARVRVGGAEFPEWLAAHREQIFRSEVEAGRMRHGGGCYRPTRAGARLYAWRTSLVGLFFWSPPQARRTARRWAEAEAAAG